MSYSNDITTIMFKKVNKKYSQILVQHSKDENDKDFYSVLTTLLHTYSDLIVHVYDSFLIENRDIDKFKVLILERFRNVNSFNYKEKVSFIDDKGKNFFQDKILKNEDSISTLIKQKTQVIIDKLNRQFNTNFKLNETYNTIKIVNFNNDVNFNSLSSISKMQNPDYVEIDYSDISKEILKTKTEFSSLLKKKEFDTISSKIDEQLSELVEKQLLEKFNLV